MSEPLRAPPAPSLSATSLFPWSPTPLQQLYDWLADERNSEKLERLLAEIDSTPPERSYSRSHIRNPDGSIDRRPKWAPASAQEPIVPVASALEERVLAR